MAAVPSARRAVGVELPAAGGDPKTAERLYERHYARVLRFCRRRLASPEDAEDAAQTTFTYALRALRRGVVPQAEIAWLLKIARNVCLTRWDAARRRSQVEVARDPHVLQELAPARAANGTEVVELQAALGRLTEQQRRAILLREWQGLSYREVAEELGLSQQAVEALLFRARRALARDLRGERQVGSGIDLGSLLTALKSLFTGVGAAVKIAAVASVLATAGALAGPPLAHRIAPGHGRRPRPAAPAVAPAAKRALVRPAGLVPTVSSRPHAVARRRGAPPSPAPGAPPSSAASRGGAGPSAGSPPAGKDPTAAPADPAQSAPSADTPSATPSPTQAPAPASSPAPAPPAPTASLPAAPTVPGVDPPTLPSPSLPSVPDLPVDPPALPPTPTVSAPIAPPSLP